MDIKKEKKFFLEEKKEGCINLMQSHFCLVFMHVDHKINTQTRTFMIISYGNFFFLAEPHIVAGRNHNRLMSKVEFVDWLQHLFDWKISFHRTI